jgi:hypothetical protein
MATIPVGSVIAGFDLAEGMLEDVLRTVPYCPEHENVWSPKLVTALLETGSQLDSLWKTRQEHRGESQVDIKDHFEDFGEDVAKRWLIFWGEDAERVQPFGEWAGLPAYSKRDYRPLP